MTNQSEIARADAAPEPGAVHDEPAPEEPSARPAAPRASAHDWRAWLSRRWPWLALCFAYLSVFPYYERLNNPNENARVWMTRAIVEHHELDIDRTSAEWGYVNDKAKFGDRNFSGKAPGTSLLGVPVLFVETKVARLWGAWPLGKRGTTLALRIFAVAIPICLFLYFLSLALEREAISGATRNLILVGVGAGTMIYPYGVIFVGHAQAAALAFSGFLLLAAEPRGAARPGRLAAAGALVGLSVIFEYQVAFVAVVLAAYAVARHRRAAWAFFAGTIPAVLVFGAYHNAVFGRPWRLPFNYVENPEWAKLHNDLRLFGFKIPSPSVVFNVLFSPDLGLFVFSPFLLLGLAGAIRALVRGPRLEAATILLVFLVMVGFLGAVPNWHAGWCVGPRYIASVAPFLAWGIVYLARDTRLDARLGPLLAALVIVSVVLCGISGALYPHYPEAFDNPLFDLAFPLLAEGYQPYGLGSLLGLRGASSLLPVGAALLAALAPGVAGNDARPRRWLAHTLGAIGLAGALLVLLSSYGRTPRPGESHAARIVRLTWEPALTPRR